MLPSTTKYKHKRNSVENLLQGVRGTPFDHHQDSQPLAGTSLQFRLLIILH